MIKFIKAILKRLFPPSRHYINRRLETIDKRLETLDKRSLTTDKKLDIISKKSDEAARKSDEAARKSDEAARKSDEAARKLDALIRQSEDAAKRFEALNNWSQNTSKHLDGMKQILTEVKNSESETGIRIERHKAEILAKLTEINKHMPKRVLYNNDFERKVVVSFYDFLKRDDFKEKFLALIKNLEPQSVETIVKILKRQQLIKDTQGKELDILTNEEQDRIFDIRKQFEIEKLKISDDLYCYKNYLLPVNHFEASVFVDKHGIDLIDNKDIITERDIIDAGGFIGDSLLILAPLTQKKIYSFEAVTENFKLLQKTIEINQLENAVAEKVALGAKRDTITINVSDSCSSVNVPLASQVTYQENVEVITLDDYVEQHALDVGLIKVDIEGYEQEFLKGAEKTIKQHKPVLLLSIYHNADDFFNIKPIIESWNLGYRFKIHKPKDFSISREVLLIAEINR